MQDHGSRLLGLDGFVVTRVDEVGEQTRAHCRHERHRHQQPRATNRNPTRTRARPVN